MHPVYFWWVSFWSLLFLSLLLCCLPVFKFNFALENPRPNQLRKILAFIPRFETRTPTLMANKELSLGSFLSLPHLPLPSSFPPPFWSFVLIIIIKLSYPHLSIYLSVSILFPLYSTSSQILLFTILFLHLLPTFYPLLFQLLLFFFLLFFVIPLFFICSFFSIYFSYSHFSFSLIPHCLHIYIWWCIYKR